MVGVKKDSKMKQNWQYKKLGEVCEIERGGSPRPINEYLTDSPDGLNWIKIGDAIEGNKYISRTKEKIKREGLRKTRYVHKGDFILSNSMSFGKPYILEIDGCIHDGWLVIHDTNNTFNKSFLYFLLGNPNMYKEFQRLAIGGVVNNLNSQLVRNVKVPVPPLSEQERIVAELDLLSGIIEKQKQQLKDLDTLSQSIFYSMFGDPISNEKNWEIKKIEEVSKIICGQDHKPVKDENGKYPIYGSGGFMGYASQYRCPENSVIIGRKGNINNPIFIDQKFWNIDTAFGVVSDNKFLNPMFFFYFCKNYDFTKHDVSVTIPSLRRTDILKIPIPIPPLSLQNQFAEKIEKIEKHKEAINKSIEETQKLFDYTMDKYFG